MMYLSLRAQKARREAAVRASDWRPTLARTKTKAIVQCPRKGGGWRGFADLVREKLPAFTFNSRRGWWEAPLEELEAAYKALSPCNLSQGAEEYLNERLRERLSYWRNWLEHWALRQARAGNYTGAEFIGRLAKTDSAGDLVWLDALVERHPDSEELKRAVEGARAELLHGEAQEVKR